MRSREVLSVFLSVALLTWGGTTDLRAQESVLVNIDDLAPREVRAEAFELSSRTSLSIEAIGADNRRRRIGRNNWFSDTDYWRGNAWIIDADSREVVWELEDERGTRGRRDYEEYEGTLDLPAGRYIAYYSSFSGVQISGNIWNGRRTSRARYDDDGLSEEFRFTIRGQGQAIPFEDVRSMPERGATFVSFREIEYDEDERIGFRVERPTEITIYAIGESTDGSNYDYGWLMNTDTREIIWRLDNWESSHAGGADKNRKSRETLTLQPGNYAAAYVSDGSHDYGEWNSAPPHDPEYWGLTLAVADPNDRNQIETFPYENLPAGNIIAQLTEVRDDETLSAGFSLSEDMDVRVYAMGEMTRNSSYDFGWIIDANTREVVWEMEYRDTDHAGGDEKNRLIDEVLSLNAGNYMVHYTSDGSHSYRDWGSGSPMDPESWGITVLGLQGYNANAVSEYDDADNPSVLARLTGIRDHDYERQDFTLEDDASIRVYAVGEGQDRTMYDYAWIENSRGRTVWEMTYRSTEWAGGARKNRRFNEIITLPAGEYTVYYESDGSHSFNDWNGDPPSDPANYGVTVFRPGN